MVEPMPHDPRASGFDSHCYAHNQRAPGPGTGLFIFQSAGLNKANLICYSREPTVLNFYSV